MFEILFAKERQEMMERRAALDGQVWATVGLTRKEVVRQLSSERDEYRTMALKAYDAANKLGKKAKELV